MTPRAWLREPLVHFLAAGALLYFIAAAFAPAPIGGRTIVLDDDALAMSLMRRTGTTDADAARKVLAAMSPGDRDKLAHDAAAEEALWREGRALGLDTVDGVVRLRTIQQMRQLLTAEATEGLAVSKAEVERFYADNRASYAEPVSASFGHLYFAGSDGRSRAEAALGRLRAGAAIEDFGDRFAYQANYAEAGAEELSAQFGIGFVEALVGLKPGAAWQGPVQSDHGWHLIQLRRLTPAKIPPLATIEDRVRDDALEAKRIALGNAAIDRLLEDYEVRSR